MEPKPVRKYAAPAYPTRLEALADPALLREHLPAAWRLRPELAGVIAIFLAANACTDSSSKSSPAASKAAIVAPIFEHGNGRGAAGCIVVAPPAFLSEDEALQVIADELTSAGLKVTGRNVVLPGVKFRPREVTFSGSQPKIVNARGTAEPLRLSFVDDDHHVAVKFVSYDDYLALGGPHWNGTAQDFNFKGVAQDVRAAVAKKGPGLYFGTFYDPSPQETRPLGEDSDEPDPNGAAGDNDGASPTMAPERKAKPSWEEIRAKAQAESRDLLRAQVKDFIDWLKGQGAI